MKTTISLTAPAQLETESLVAVVLDHSENDHSKKDHSEKDHSHSSSDKNKDEKNKDAKPHLRVESNDPAVQSSAAELLASGELTGKPFEINLLHKPAGLKAKRILLLSGGKTKKFTGYDLRRRAGAAVRSLKSRGIRSFAFIAPSTIPPEEAVRAIVEGALVGNFDADYYRSDRKDQKIDALTILTERAKTMSAEVGLKYEVSVEDTINALKMGAFWSVAQGSDEPPALIIMRYEPAGAPETPVLGLVGKGVTFDTGGISIKPADGMEKMKYDMAGGAAMIGAMRGIALLKPKGKVISVICASENMPSGKAQKPGDIQIAMSGKSIEIINTDAEGRLVLADGLHYARQLGATHLIDAATLTGAVAVALGQINAGVFANNEEAFLQFSKALEISGEKFWRLPVEDEYREQIRSSIDDIQDTGQTRYGGAITAAMFLKEFVEDTPWLHLDIAGLAWLDADKSWIARGPSGIGVRSIVEW